MLTLADHKRSQPVTTSSRAAGFTLLELMIALLLAAILAMIALPNYQDHVRKTRRQEAVTALIDLSLRLERHYAKTSAFPATTTETSSLLAAINPAPSYYTLSFENIGTDSTATTYKIKATRISSGPQASDDECGDYTLTNESRRTTSGTGTLEKCWPKP